MYKDGWQPQASPAPIRREPKLNWCGTSLGEFCSCALSDLGIGDSPIRITSLFLMFKTKDAPIYRIEQIVIIGLYIEKLK